MLVDSCGESSTIAPDAKGGPTSQPDPAELLAKHMHGKQKEWDAVAERKKPLGLLDLPLDIHQAILREVTHTNDLTALALTHSVLHDLVIPQIYSRFDIVWPEANTQVESRIGVDALTYGLATLVMAPDVFGEEHDHQRQMQAHTAASSPRKIRRGNHFAQYTKKFSLGNGPHDWVQDYMITKEGGKMLGTLVALAVGRMRNLESFIWDMPTGVLRDVWLALASLGNRDDGQECRLEKVWVRWHDNSDTNPVASPPIPGSGPPAQGSNIPSILSSSANALFQIPPYPRVEFPTFSILPPLKSLNVLDIDELSYVEEMSVLIERSLSTLRELRVGLAEHAQYEPWALGPNERAVPSLTGITRWRSRQGGLLGTLVRRFCPPSSVEEEASTARRTLGDDPESLQLPNAHGLTSTPSSYLPGPKWDPGTSPENPEIQGLVQNMANHALDDDTTNRESLELPKKSGVFDVVASGRALRPTDRFGSSHAKLLQLETLELERTHINIGIMYNAIDWSRLKSLTLLGCRDHEPLWKELRKTFTPQSRFRTSSMSARSVSASLGEMFSPRSSSSSSTPREEYLLNLKRIHTDTVSPALIAFIKDALAPDSLESLFLQESPHYRSPVTIDTIYKGAVRRHRNSLKKLLIDSDSRKLEEPPSTSWKRWIFNRDLLTCVTNGKMRLRELSMAIDYKDWHFFIQRLPRATSIRSLHITHIGDPIAGAIDSKEAALQILDIVSLRPELELCYLGVKGQCFEVLEYMASCRATSPTAQSNVVSHSGLDSDDNDEVEVESHAAGNGESDFEVDSSHGEESEDEEAQGASVKPSFRLREILFYDDKVAIFRARHGKL